MCCICAGSCNHIGNHGYCEAHGGKSGGLSWTSPNTQVFPPLFVDKAALLTKLRDEVEGLHKYDVAENGTWFPSSRGIFYLGSEVLALLEKAGE